MKKKKASELWGQVANQYLKNSCNYCQNQMKYSVYAGEVKKFYFCHNPKCPSYALLQIAQEDMPDDN